MNLYDRERLRENTIFLNSLRRRLIMNYEITKLDCIEFNGVFEEICYELVRLKKVIEAKQNFKHRDFIVLRYFIDFYTEMKEELLNEFPISEDPDAIDLAVKVGEEADYWYSYYCEDDEVLDD